MTLAECQKVLAEAAAEAHRSDFPPVAESDHKDEYEAHGHHAEFGAAHH